MGDLISRSKAVDAIENLVASMSICLSLEECRGMRSMRERAVRALEQLPSAQPDVPDINVGDMINRSAAIDAVNAYLGLSQASRTIQNMTSIQEILENLPPAQPEIIRCKDCKWKQGAECVRFAEIRPFPDDFCSRGERRAYG